MATVSQSSIQDTASSQAGFARYASMLQLVASLFLLLDASPAAFAQNAAETVEEITVTGTRRTDRSPTDLPSPVDMIDAEQLLDQGDTDTINLIRAVVPSFNSDANPLSGTPTYMRPVSLRGLSPDHVLVLMNGKRRHRGANVATFSGGNTDGSQGPDISSIPAIALKRIEVLRDGAAAQYGSDAMAGVMNFILDDSPEGGHARAKWGTTYDGDGDRYQLAGSFGLPLGDSGFFRLSAEVSEQEESIRGIQRPDAAALAAGGHPLVDPSAIKQPVVTKYGIPEIEDELRVALNVGAPIGNTEAEFYGFGTFATRTVHGDFFFRNPIDRFGVFTDANGDFLIGDMTPGDGANCEGGVDFGGTGMVNNPIGINDPDTVTRMNTVFADPNCFNFLEAFPGGYTPRFGADVNDLFGSTGVRGEFANGLTYDVSASAGRSEIQFFASNVPNPSMGSQSPSTFSRVGGHIVLENLVNIDVAYPVEVAAFASPLNIAAGFEWHDEQFEIVAGEPASFEAGVLADQGFLIGEEAIPGFSPLIAGEFNRHNIAGYLDFEADVTDRLVLGAAVRHEDFSDDTGTETTYKVSGMLRFTDAMA
ncbi:MAG: TonB-dependent receptor plug domain-containing protein, partial [Woeseiaceae bacterium]